MDRFSVGMILHTSGACMPHLSYLSSPPLVVAINGCRDEAVDTSESLEKMEAEKACPSHTKVLSIRQVVEEEAGETDHLVSNHNHHGQNTHSLYIYILKLPL